MKLRTLSACRELVRQGYLQRKEYNLEKEYVRHHVPTYAIIAYLILIWPIVLLMRACPFITPSVAVIARRIWINDTVLKTAAMYHNKPSFIPHWVARTYDKGK